MMNKVNKKILLLGNKGQVGREIEELAIAQGMRVYGLDIDSLDITNAAEVEAFFAGHNDIDIAINAAAYTAVDKAEDEAAQAYTVNCDAVKNLAKACRKYDIPLLHISTDYVFSGEKRGAYVESDATSPLGVYGKSKLAGEEVLAKIWEKHVILRISWVFGKYGNNFVKTILRLAQDREKLNIVSDQHGCPTEASDVARVLLVMAAQIFSGKSRWGIYHYCGYPVTNWFEFAEKIAEFGHAKYAFKLRQLHTITTAEYPTKAARPKNSELLVDKIIRDYGIKRRRWIDSLQDVINVIELWREKIYE